MFDPHHTDRSQSFWMALEKKIVVTINTDLVLHSNKEKLGAVIPHGDLSFVVTLW